MKNVVCVKLKYEDEIRRMVAATAEKDETHRKLILKDENGKITGEIELDRVESWWLEAPK